MIKIDLAYIQREGLRREREFVKMLASKGKGSKAIRRLDDQVHALHDAVFDEIDCLDCANCCKSLGPCITERDIQRLARRMKLKEVEFIHQYLHLDEDRDYVFQSMPCPFLAPDNHCFVYEDRPKACREYPHTDRKKIVQIAKLTAKNAQTCPAVFEIFRSLDEIIDK